MKKPKYLNKIISSLIILTFILTPNAYPYESAKNTLRLPLMYKKTKAIEIISIAEEYPLAKKMIEIIHNDPALRQISYQVEVSNEALALSLHNQASTAIDEVIALTANKQQPISAISKDFVNVDDDDIFSSSTLFIIVTNNNDVVEALQQKEQILAKNKSRMLILTLQGNPNVGPRGKGNGVLLGFEHKFTNDEIEETLEAIETLLGKEWEARVDKEATILTPKYLFDKRQEKLDELSALPASSQKEKEKAYLKGLDFNNEHWIERESEIEREFKGLLRFYSLNNLTWVPDHYGVERLRGYLSGDLTPTEKKLYARHTGYELLALLKYCYMLIEQHSDGVLPDTLDELITWHEETPGARDSAFLKKVTDWLDKEGDPLEVWRALFAIHKNAPKVPGEKSDILAHFEQVYKVLENFSEIHLIEKEGYETGKTDRDIFDDSLLQRRKLAINALTNIVDDLVATENLEALDSMRDFLYSLRRTSAPQFFTKDWALGVIDEGIDRLFRTTGRPVRGKADMPGTNSGRVEEIVKAFYLMRLRSHDPDKWVSPIKYFTEHPESLSKDVVIKTLRDNLNSLLSDGREIVLSVGIVDAYLALCKWDFEESKSSLKSLLEFKLEYVGYRNISMNTKVRMLKAYEKKELLSLEERKKLLGCMAEDIGTRLDYLYKINRGHDEHDDHWERMQEEFNAFVDGILLYKNTPSKEILPLLDKMWCFAADALMEYEKNQRKVILGLLLKKGTSLLSRRHKTKVLDDIFSIEEVKRAVGRMNKENKLKIARLLVHHDSGVSVNTVIDIFKQSGMKKILGDKYVAKYLEGAVTTSSVIDELNSKNLKRLKTLYLQSQSHV